MSIAHCEIYKNYTAEYDLLRSRMDYKKNILDQLTAIAEIKNKAIVEFAAGTGTLTQLIAPLAKSVKAFDISSEMLQLNTKKIILSGYTNCQFEVADNRKIPLPDNCADIVLEPGIYCCCCKSRLENGDRKSIKGIGTSTYYGRHNHYPGVPVCINRNHQINYWKTYIIF
jgi:SAM-dependent methyltransferase